MLFLKNSKPWQNVLSLGLLAVTIPGSLRQSEAAGPKLFDSVVNTSLKILGQTNFKFFENEVLHMFSIVEYVYRLKVLRLKIR